MSDAIKGHIYSGLLAIGAGVSNAFAHLSLWSQSLGVTTEQMDGYARLLIDVGSVVMLILSIIGWFRAWKKTKE